MRTQLEFVIAPDRKKDMSSASYANVFQWLGARNYTNSLLRGVKVSA
jgi:hypothetical protein